MLFSTEHLNKTIRIREARQRERGNLELIHSRPTIEALLDVFILAFFISTLQTYIFWQLDVPKSNLKKLHINLKHFSLLRLHFFFLVDFVNFIFSLLQNN